MRRWILTSPLIVLAVTLAVAASTYGDGSSGTPAVQPAPGCSIATASGPNLGWANPTFTTVGAGPFGVAAARGYAFVANAAGKLDVLADHDSAPHLIHTVPLPGPAGLGMTITQDGRYLVIADGGDGADVVDVAMAEAGDAHAVLGTLRGRSAQGAGGGAIETAVSRDGRYAFVSLEDSAEVAVYNLASAIADHFDKSSYVGAIPTGLAPVGLAVSPNGRWLYSTSEIAGRSTITGRIRRRLTARDGSLSAISVGAAEHHPARSVIATVSAGCSPVRVAVSPSGNQVWVDARESDELLAFSSARLRSHANDPELAIVRVGEAPVGLAVVDGGSRVIVADSNRFDAAGEHAALTLVNIGAALAHRAAIVGTIRAGLFPRDMALEPAGTVLLVSNFGSGTLEAVHVVDHAQESHH